VDLAIADPPYPPFVGSGGRKNRASRWYGAGQRSRKDVIADQHPDAADWDEPVRHRQLLEELVEGYDGWAIATSPDGIAAYGTLPSVCRIMAWVKPNGQPGAHRLRSVWEPVILFPPVGRRSNRKGVGSIPDVLTCNAPRGGFKGQKPEEWTHWILRAFSYQAGDSVVDVFSGSGAVEKAIKNFRCE
jgi:hypothetical protein